MFEKYDEVHEHAKQQIKDYINGTNDEMKAIASFFVESDINPYSFLPSEWAGSVITATGLCDLLNYLDHAINDDGDICFYAVDGSPRIKFVNKYDVTDPSDWLHSSEKLFEQRSKKKSEITFIDDVFQFIDKLQKYHIADLKRCFANDVAMFNVEFAIDHYGEYKQFDPDWINQQDVIDQIEHYKKMKEIRNGKK